MIPQGILVEYYLANFTIPSLYIKIPHSLDSLWIPCGIMYSTGIHKESTGNALNPQGMCHSIGIPYGFPRNGLNPQGMTHSLWIPCGFRVELIFLRCTPSTPHKIIFSSWSIGIPCGIHLIPCGIHCNLHTSNVTSYLGLHCAV